MTKNLIYIGKKLKIKNFIFTSSNSIFLGNDKSFIFDDEVPIQLDMYGKSKYESELILNENQYLFNINILRCPNIIDVGRVGMLSILFELLQANATLWVINSGKIKHQCLFAQDLNSVIFKLIFEKKSNVFNIGSDNVPTFLTMYLQLIEWSGSKSNVRSLPNFLVIPILKILYRLNLSPLGPYQFRMLTSDFIFDLSKIKKTLNWFPTKTNSEILLLAYNYYVENKQTIRTNQSANSKSVNLGLLSILKFIKF
jgi:UDP-glucose 4-epimerase